MLGSRTIGLRLRRIAVVLAALLVPLAVVPAAAPAQEFPASINSGYLSSWSIPNTGGTVTVVANIFEGTGISGVYAEIGGGVNAHVPLTEAAFNDWTGSFDVPPNYADYPLTFGVTIYGIDADGNILSLYLGEGTQAETPVFNEPPSIYDPSVTPSNLPYTGGTVNLAVSASDLTGLSSVYALVSTGPGYLPDRVELEAISADRFAGTFTAPANTTNPALTWFVHFVAEDDIGQQSSAVGEFTVGPQPTGSLEVKPGDRDFGKVKVGKSAQRTIQLRNLGGKGTFPITGVLKAAAPFSVAGQTATGLPFTIKPGETKTFTIGFAPTALGLATGKVSVLRTDAKQPGLGTTVTGRGT